jgi:hypothetical protein
VADGSTMVKESSFSPPKQVQVLQTFPAPSQHFLQRYHSPRRLHRAQMAVSLLHPQTVQRLPQTTANQPSIRTSASHIANQQLPSFHSPPRQCLPHPHPISNLHLRPPLPYFHFSQHPVMQTQTPHALSSALESVQAPQRCTRKANPAIASR